MEEKIFNKLKNIKTKFEELEEKLGDPDIISNSAKYKEITKEHFELKQIYDKFCEYENAYKNYQECLNILENEKDEELRELAKEEKKVLERKLKDLEHNLKIMLLPKDPNDEKNVIMEIRAGTGGEEAALFAADLFRMYTRYAEKKGWKVEVLSANETGLGGFKEVIFLIQGKGAYSRLKFESGVHRVQRVPVTESSGRIHTSAATVAVLPEAEDVEVEIKEDDLIIETFRSSGAGGQHVNTTDSAVRITHKPTGIVVSCQSERSQIQNRMKAMKILRARLKDYYERQKKQEIDSMRKSLVGSGDRSEKIRTYNFPQGRVTDHRINLTVYNLQEVLNGELDEIIDALALAEQTRKLEELEV